MRGLFRVLIATAFTAQGALFCSAQAIDEIIVETYHVIPGENGEPDLTTYRIFVDLAPDHQLQVVYGEEHHALEITTTTEFFNDGEHGVKYGDRVNGDRLNSFPLAIDSWLTMGAASDRHVGVPKSLDTDGSVLECPPYAVRHSETLNTVHPPSSLCIQDGLLAVPRVPEVVNFRMDPSYLHQVRGSSLRTIDGAWAVLGGIKGYTDHNTVLIAQLTTTGELSFHLNVQIRTPEGEVVKYVAMDPRSGEVQYPGLSFGALRVP